MSRRVIGCRHPVLGPNSHSDNRARRERLPSGEERQVDSGQAVSTGTFAAPTVQQEVRVRWRTQRFHGRDDRKTTQEGACSVRIAPSAVHQVSHDYVRSTHLAEKGWVRVCVGISEDKYVKDASGRLEHLGGGSASIRDRERVQCTVSYV